MFKIPCLLSGFWNRPHVPYFNATPGSAEEIRAALLIQAMLIF